ncbi:hypothetical protein [Vibrio penaeicida]|uniref:hypothetical protein n=1 Tax=Vibrio penaeicida TaxID=104609 RepID=UPI000CEA4D85|nr:hypothetical protein [Vibrio penaeicida]
MKNILLLSAILTSGCAVAQNSVYQLHPDSAPNAASDLSVDGNTRLVSGTQVLNTQTQESVTITGNVLILVEDESQLRKVAQDFGLRLTKYTAGSPLGVFKASENVDLNQLQKQLQRDERVRQVRIETDEKRYIAH